VLRTIRYGGGILCVGSPWSAVLAAGTDMTASRFTRRAISMQPVLNPKITRSRDAVRG
jgi:hypothetical protein